MTNYPDFPDSYYNCLFKISCSCQSGLSGSTSGSSGSPYTNCDAGTIYSNYINFTSKLYCTNNKLSISPNNFSYALNDYNGINTDIGL